MKSSNKVTMMEIAFLTDADYRQTVLETLTENRIVVHSAAKELLEIPNAPAPQEVALSHLTKKISGVMKDSGKPINLFSSEGQTALEIMAILTELAENFETRIVGYIPVRYLPPRIADWAELIFSIPE